MNLLMCMYYGKQAHEHLDFRSVHCTKLLHCSYFYMVRVGLQTVWVYDF